MSKFSKAIATGASAIVINKYVGGIGTKSSMIIGGITGASTYAVDMVSSFLPQLRGMFSFAGSYAEDVISSLISTLLIALYASYSSGSSFTDLIMDFRSFIAQFLYSLGATVMGTYGAPMVQGLTG